MSESRNFWNFKSSKHGARPKWGNPIELEEACLEYFDKTAQRTDWNKQEWVGRDGYEVSRNIPIPFTVSGLCLFLGITLETWCQYRKNEILSDVCTRVDQIIVTQKFEGAATGHFNHAIIARDLGLADQINHASTIQIEGIGTIELNELLSDDDE